MTNSFLEQRGRALEESFFRARNAQLMEQLRQQIQLEAKRAEFAMVSGITDPKVLDRFINLDLTPATVAALALVPMVRVAWADDTLSQKERETILQAAVDSGLHTDSAAYHWLVTWLEKRPEPDLTAAWEAYVEVLRETLSDDDREALRRGLIDRAQQVAQAAGGLLGLGNKISPQEQAILDQLEAAFGP